MGTPGNTESLIAAARSGDKRAVGRLISHVENDPVDAAAVLRQVYAETRNAWVTGITGAPGAGKSTLVNLLVGAWSGAGKRVAVLAVDPTSPFTGGALLGDRIRMEQRSGGSDVLFRSMATRGWLGGLARATERVATLCAGLGYDEVVIETVGVGQSEVDVAATADSTIVVVTPAWGDGVQVAKAGVMEIGDVFVVNKADRDGVDDTVRELIEMLGMSNGVSWEPPVVTTVATAGHGRNELLEALHRHRAAVEGEGSDSRIGKRRRRDFHRALKDAFEASAAEALGKSIGTSLEADVVAGSIDPWTAAAELLRTVAAD
ncbi:MAG: methylmalonyl Co-A mutase-associated GTPase MeaB [bacterium]|nr:methylmalonyl Co-A mutase-associated GTPase MeaB [bacterium]